jgi:hypothetical protein
MFSLILAAFPAASLHAAAFGVTVSGDTNYVTEGLFDCLAADPGWPGASTSQTATGLTTPSVILTDSGSGSGRGFPSTSTSTFAPVSVTEGHTGMFFSADASGIGNAEADGEASWNDTLTIGGPAPGSPVTLVATMGIEAQFLGQGNGHAVLNGCFNSVAFGQLCVFGSSGTDGVFPNVLPKSTTIQFTAHVGDTFVLQGNLSGSAYANNLGTGNPSSDASDWSLLATNSAHYTITSLTPGVDLTLASGCSITNGLGCDSPVSGAPEPGSLLLVGAALLAARCRHWVLREMRSVKFSLW